MVKIDGLTSQNNQPEPPTRKPNEDYFAFLNEEHTVVAAVMDGIPVLRNTNETYPVENGSMASKAAADTIVHTLKQSPDPSTKELNAAFVLANKQVRKENELHNMYQKEHSLWLATVGCAFWANTKTGKAVFGHIGDPFAFLIPPTGQVTLLIGQDQQQSVRSHTREGHPGYSGYEHDARRWNDKHVRNHHQTSCWCGAAIEGWGGLTGEKTAMEFVELQEFKIIPGTRIILSSDAIDVFAQNTRYERSPQDYQDILSKAATFPAMQAAEFLRDEVRKEEQHKQSRSDDATFVVIDF